ncbi:hypothetical protein HPB49_023023 [Dermacentor silvarum]|uniref:Uncharacterized protein n=1 Tax=Dermacentor silvarum TaxID=543639 RepID=A0ACB8DL46_DERSI|nr:hypothetical protein HPB49_023023 [Dermacentor silvarum]
MTGKGGSSGSSGTPATFTRDLTTPFTLLRFKRDLADFNADPPPAIFMAPQKNDATGIDAILMGAAETPYEGGFFYFFVRCTDRHPIDRRFASLQPALVGCGSTSASRPTVRSVSAHSTFTSRLQSAVPSLSSLLTPIQSLMCELPEFMDREAAKHFEKMIQQESLRVAMCDTVEAFLGQKRPFPSVF